MSDHLPPPVTVDGQTQKKGTSCWVTGCGGCLVLLLVLIGVGAWIGWQINKNFMVDPFQPMDPSLEERAEMDARLEQLEEAQKQAEETGGNWIPPEGLIFTEREVNYWITQEDPEVEDSVRLDFEPGEIRVELRVGEPGESKRLKLTALLTVNQTEEGLDVRLADIKLGSFSLPDSFLEELGNENLAQDALNDPEVREQLEESIGSVNVLKDAIQLLPFQE